MNLSDIYEGAVYVELLSECDCDGCRGGEPFRQCRIPICARRRGTRSACLSQPWRTAATVIIASVSLVHAATHSAQSSVPGMQVVRFPEDLAEFNRALSPTAKDAASFRSPSRHYQDVVSPYGFSHKRPVPMRYRPPSRKYFLFPPALGMGKRRPSFHPHGGHVFRRQYVRRHRHPGYNVETAFMPSKHALPPPAAAHLRKPPCRGANCPRPKDGVFDVNWKTLGYPPRRKVLLRKYPHLPVGSQQSAMGGYVAAASIPRPSFSPFHNYGKRYRPRYYVYYDPYDGKRSYVPTPSYND